MEMKQRNSVVFERAEQDKTLYSFWTLVKSAMWSYAVWALFLLSAVLMGLLVFPIEGVSAPQLLIMGILLALLIFVFEVLLPYITQNWKKPFGWILRWLIAGGIVYFGQKLFYAYYLNRRLDLEDGLLALVKNYVNTYNIYYKKSIEIPPGKEQYVAMAFVFCFLIAILVQYLLVQLSGVRAFVLLLPCAVFCAELWIGRIPDVKSLFVFSVSFILFSVGKGGSWKVKGAAVFVWGLLFGLSVFTLKVPAEHLILKAPKYKAFQKQLETQITNLHISDLWTNREHVSNRKPEYSDKEILTITADTKINGNLYLKAFTGTTYDNGSWTEDDSSFSNACQAAGIDETQMENLLWNEAAHEFSDMLLYARPANYTISYKNPMQSNALVPYFSDLTDMADLRIEGDNKIKKSWMAQVTNVSGVNVNDAIHAANTLLTAYDADASYDSNWDWYGTFASDIYRNTNEQVSSGEYVSGEYVSSISQSTWDSLDKRKTNMLRLVIASGVSDYLCSNYTYSWNLDDISDGTDSVEYFLSSGKKGYCMHFASAGTLILRELGIPARYAAGYIVKSRAFESNEDGTYSAVVLDRNAHAWTEIYLENIGWVPIEMTAGYSQANAALPTDKEIAEEREESERNSQTQDTEKSEEADTQESETTEAQNLETEIESEAETEVDTQENAEEETEGSLGGIQTTESGGQGPSAENQNLSGWENRIVRTVLKLGCLFIGIAGLAGGGIALVHRQIQMYHERLNRDLRRKNYRKAAKRINRRILKKLKRRVNVGRNIKDSQYEHLLKAHFTEISSEEWTQYMSIVKKAAFSGEELEEKEAMLCYEIYKRILNVPIS